MTNRSLFDHSERFPFAAVVVAAVIAAVGLYLILHRAAPIVATPAPTPAPKPSPPPVAFAPTVEPPAQAAAPRGPAIYRCKVNGTTTYSDAPCPGGRRIDATPAAQGFAMPRTQLSASVAHANVEAQSSATTASEEKARRAARCEWIEKAIEAIDAQARQGQTPVIQDRLREDRQRLVDERYALKC